MSERLDSDQGDENGVDIPMRCRHYMALDVPTLKWGQFKTLIVHCDLLSFHCVPATLRCLYKSLRQELRGMHRVCPFYIVCVCNSVQNFVLEPALP